MGKHLGNYLMARREEHGWTLGHVARRLGYANVSKGARRVHLMEQGETVSPDLLAKLVPLLGIESAQVEALIAQDRHEFVAAWKKWADEPLPIEIVVRSIPGVFGRHAVLAELNTPDEVVAYAQGYARRIGKKVFVILSRRATTSINESGEVTGQHEGTPDCDPRPFMRAGSKRFLLPMSHSGDAPIS